MNLLPKGEGKVSNYMFPHKNVTLHLQGVGYNVLFCIIYNFRYRVGDACYFLFISVWPNRILQEIFSQTQFH